MVVPISRMVEDSDWMPTLAVATARGRYPARAVGTLSSVARTTARCELTCGLFTYA